MISMVRSTTLPRRHARGDCFQRARLQRVGYRCPLKVGQRHLAVAVAHPKPRQPDLAAPPSVTWLSCITWSTCIRVEMHRSRCTRAGGTQVERLPDVVEHREHPASGTWIATDARLAALAARFPPCHALAVDPPCEFTPVLPQDRGKESPPHFTLAPFEIGRYIPWDGRRRLDEQDRSAGHGGPMTRELIQIERGVWDDEIRKTYALMAMLNSLRYLGPAQE